MYGFLGPASLGPPGSMEREVWCAGWCGAHGLIFLNVTPGLALLVGCYLPGSSSFSFLAGP
eukprot:12003573-Heterocapsa_arctica.AAC.1